MLVCDFYELTLFLPQLCQYEEDYQGMLKELSLAAALDPGWDAPKVRLKGMWTFLLDMASLISNKASHS